MLCCSGIGLLSWIGSANAQDPPEWIALDGLPPGTPAEVVFDQRASSPQTSFFEVRIHGFYVENKLGADGQIYQKLIVPGLGHMDQVGAPQLPVLPPSPIVIVTGASETRLEDVDYLDLRPLDGFNVWPQPLSEAMDHEEGEPEVFARDDAIYRLQTPWPAQDGVASTPTTMALGLPSVQARLWPFKWNPTTRQLLVGANVRYTLNHSGTPTVFPPMTKERARLAQDRFINWSAVQTWMPINLIFYSGEFLFIYPPGYDDELKQLIKQKKMRGYAVTEMTTAQTGTSCASIRAAINAWYAGTPPEADKYCLLVGDVSAIPLCTAPTNVPTDDLYASTNGDDLDEEIFLGRLSVDSEADASNQVAKILRYEENPDDFCCYHRVLLTAHKEDAPGKYVGAHESVRTAFYSIPPTFATQYGHQAGVTDANVSTFINSGLGLVAYRGHGTDASWVVWNLGNENYDAAEVTALTNPAQRVPVLWSFACNNNELGVNDCIGETWMEDRDNRAASHYGATVPSGTDANHELDRQMFKAVYDKGLVVQSQAIEEGEAKMAALEGSGNAWMYLLLGDPEMSIRRRNPTQWVIQVPQVYEICTDCFLPIEVLNAEGDPVRGAQVSLWKPGQGAGKAGGAADEVFDNRYTDDAGVASIPAEPTTAGYIYYTVEDDIGNAIVDSIPVSAGTGVGPAGARGLILEPTPSVTSAMTTLQFGQGLPEPATVELYNVTGQLVRTIDAPQGSQSVKWDATDGEGRRVSPGMYFARYHVGSQAATARITIVR